ncbi:MAG: hypothetical protein Tp158DCM1228761_59 [Prokaryotic dsDNA virus sp.]|nr:MAG: hypothetical protein Tp158DCM1228761_59 [Prokaryotic dsDNA virus sp.]|tara:strand:- start:3698 stop:4165 length:468 start_codon:yes stop_codon:yes gene_type:complete
MNIGIYEDVISGVDEYVEDILAEGFEDVQLGHDLFKNVKARGVDQLVMFLHQKYPMYKADLNFVRKSPENQEEPNFIHTDEMMGDLTAILYLNKEHPKEDGTTLYMGRNKMCILRSAYNRLIVFPSNLFHSRNIYENFGQDDKARLIQVCFLKKV